MNKETLEKWLDSTGHDWEAAPILPVFAKKFVFGAITRGNHHDELTIYLGPEGDLYIKAGGDWDYEWTIKGNDQAEGLLEFLLEGR